MYYSSYHLKMIFFCFILQSLEAKYEFDLFSAKVLTCAVTTLKTLRDVAQQIA